MHFHVTVYCYVHTYPVVLIAVNDLRRVCFYIPYCCFNGDAGGSNLQVEKMKKIEATQHRITTGHQVGRKKLLLNMPLMISR